MEWISPELCHLPRQTDFPLIVAGVYYCNDSIFSALPHTSRRHEICLRLNESAELCRDLVEGVPMNVSYPHVLFKSPGMETQMADDLPRNTLAFWYAPEQAALLRQWRLVPEEKFWSISPDETLTALLARLRHLLICYTSEHMIDQLDWVCFQILRELMLARISPPPEPRNRLKEAALYLEHHYDRKINCDTVAAKFGFSHASFFRQWKMQFDISPQEYLRRHRLKIAALRLIQSSLPIADIAREVHFANLTAFHRDFKAFYGVTPALFRCSKTLQEKFLSDKKI